MLLLLDLPVRLGRLHEASPRLIEDLERDGLVVENGGLSFLKFAFELKHEVHWGQILILLTFALGVSEDFLEDSIFVFLV